MTTWITVCDTCKREGWEAGDMELTDGERLAELVESETDGEAGVKVRRLSCLMGCGKGCNVAIQGSGKVSYTLGNFIPEKAAAEAIVDYARCHAVSETGVVPYGQWPQAIKGHFVTRHPPLPRE
ncbi:MAG: DUF1636 domain-containing protein [Rhodobacter sp.]|nr:DUF1636 domain-containing protein [Rhodobacter sp.]